MARCEVSNAIKSIVNVSAIQLNGNQQCCVFEWVFECERWNERGQRASGLRMHLQHGWSEWSREWSSPSIVSFTTCCETFFFFSVAFVFVLKIIDTSGLSLSPMSALHKRHRRVYASAEHMPHRQCYKMCVVWLLPAGCYHHIR